MSEWGPWIEHDGKGCPCVGKLCNVISNTGDNVVVVAGADCIRRGQDPNGPTSAWVWGELERDVFFVKCVIRYRIRKPRALLNLIEMVENLPAPERIDA